MGQSTSKRQDSDEVSPASSEDTGNGVSKGKGKAKPSGSRREVEVVGPGRCIPLPGRSAKPPHTRPSGPPLSQAPGDTTKVDPEVPNQSQSVNWGAGWTSQPSSSSKQAPPPPPPEPAPWDGNGGQPTSHTAPVDYEMNGWVDDQMLQHWGAGPNGLQAPPSLPAPSLGLPSMPISQAQREAEAELQRKNVQIMALTHQIQAAQAELQQLRSQHHASDESARSQAARGVAAARIRQARELVAGTKPEVESMKENLAKSLMVAKKLDHWFVQNAEKMQIQDPRSTPSAFLDKLLESCDRRLEVLSSGITQTMSGVASSGTSCAVTSRGSTQATVQPYISGYQGTEIRSQPLVQQHAGAVGSNLQQQQQQQLHPQQLQPQPQPIGTQVGPTPEASKPGGTGVPGMWVRDPDAA